MDPRIRHQVGLELGDVDVQGTIEPEGGSERGDDLRDEPVQVGVGGPLNVEVPSADIIDSLVIKHNSNISMFKKGVGGQDRVVWLNHSCGYLG